MNVNSYDFRVSDKGFLFTLLFIVFSAFAITDNYKKIQPVK